jgi:hypothetical protein
VPWEFRPFGDVMAPSTGPNVPTTFAALQDAASRGGDRIFAAISNRRAIRQLTDDVSSAECEGVSRTGHYLMPL